MAARPEFIPSSQEMSVFALESLIIISIITFIVGAIIGVVAGRAWVPPERQRDLEKRLATAQDELNNYQQEVAKHFMETSHRVGELTQSYRDLHEHLAKGALNLTNTDIGRQLIDAGSSKDALTNFDDTAIEPPKDWAPKTPGSQGMLSEEFGLKDRDEEEFRSPAGPKLATNPDEEDYRSTEQHESKNDDTTGKTKT